MSGAESMKRSSTERRRSAAYRVLATLEVGDVVPRDLYVMDYADGTRPVWRVVQRSEHRGGVVQLVVEDPDNGSCELPDDGTRLRLMILTWPAKTLRSQLYSTGTEPQGMLCDMDQQARAAGKTAPV